MFRPDEEIFKETIVFDYETLRFRFQQCAFLNKGLRISLTDKRVKEPKSVTYCYDGGISEYVKFLNETKTPIHPQIIYVQAITMLIMYS